MKKINETSANAIGAELGSEPTVHQKKFRFNFDSEYEILPLDVARKIGEFVHVDFDHIKVEDLYAGMKTEAKNASKTPTTIKDWIFVAKIAKEHLDKNPEYYDNWVSEAVRKVIREEIKKILKEYKKYYQDGAEFFDYNTGKLIAEYPKFVKNDFDIQGAKEARKQFQREYSHLYSQFVDAYNGHPIKEDNDKQMKEASFLDYEPVDKKLKDKGIFVAYKKPWKGAEQTAIAFIGKTYDYRDIFNRITQMHKGGNKRESDKRFRWSSDFKFWYTFDSESADMAKKMITRGEL